MGNDYDCREPANQLPNATIRLCAILSARRRTGERDNGAHLSRGYPVRAHTSGWIAAVVVLPKRCDDRSELVELIGR